MIDLAEVMYGSESYQPFNVTRRAEAVGNNGRNTLTTTPFNNVYGDVWPEQPREIDRRPDGSLPQKIISVVTQFALHDNTHGFQADLIQWGGDTYVVDRIEDWSHVAPQFIKATCYLYQATATAPVIPNGS